MKKMKVVLIFSAISLLVLSSCGQSKEMKEYLKQGTIAKLDEENEILTYGFFPQSAITDEEKVFSLNHLRYPNKYNYYEFDNKYFCKMVAHPYATGVKFKDGTVIQEGKEYWFNVEPVKWRVLDEENGKYFVTTIDCLINHNYDDNFNNYKDSLMREWLNKDFFEQIFCYDKDNVQVTNVDNSASSAGNKDGKYCCENTNDKVFLLSHFDVTNYYYDFDPDDHEVDGNRMIYSTDYARAMGVSFNSEKGVVPYYLRSPSEENAYNQRYVMQSGACYYSCDKNDNAIGVRPAINMYLD